MNLPYEKMRAVTGGKFILGDAFYAQLYAVGIRDRKLYRKLLNGVMDAPNDILSGRGHLVTGLAKGRAKWLLEKEDTVFENMGTTR